MLNLSLLSFFYILFTSSSVYPLAILMMLMLLYYMTSLSMSSNSPLLSVMGDMLHDEMGLFMSLLTFFIIVMSFVYALSFSNYKLMTVTLLSLLFFCLQVFTTDSMFLLYFFYESSLVPILFIIVKWGSYPERSISAIVMLFYTLFFSAPFILILVTIYLSLMTFSFSILTMYSYSSTLLVTVLIFMAFAVKLPMYGLHQWLPMAHVEAPTFGSVILAALLLKLGGVGLVRMLPFMNISHLTSSILGYLMVMTVFSFLCCCFQSDMKRLIAYSSVAHMMTVPILVLSMNMLSVQSIVMIMLFHGLSSSMLFMLVGTLYSMYGSRQLVLMRGLILISPLLSFLAILMFFFTISAPPFPSFIAEVYFMMSSYIMSANLVWVFIPMVFLGLLYNLNWLVSVLFSGSINMNYSESNIKYVYMMPLALILINTLSFMFMFFLF
uniref:NADH-ubiquinone oxidoreductase chain 4 n=1 Tax=Asplanchna sp. TaxID=3231738 RepID=A0AB39A6E6_9BILA